MIGSIGIVSFDDAFAQYMGNVGSSGETGSHTTKTSITTDRDSYTYTQNLDIVISGNIGNVQLPITLIVSCDAMPNPQSYITIFNNDVENYKAVDESGNFEHVIGTLGFGCNKQTSTGTITIEGTNISTSFQMIGDESNHIFDIMYNDLKFKITGYEKNRVYYSKIFEDGVHISTGSYPIDSSKGGDTWMPLLFGTDGKDTTLEWIWYSDSNFTIKLDSITWNRAATPAPTPAPGPTPIPDEVFICHNGNIIKVNVNAIDAHLKHNDTIGECFDQHAPTQPTPDNPLTIITALGSGVPGCENSTGCYIPNTMNVKVGDTVMWDNIDSAAHTVTSGNTSSGVDELFDSGIFMSGDSFEFTFNEAGTFDYFCMVHPWMIGIIIVQESSSYVTTPQPTYESTPNPKSTPKETDELEPEETGGYMGNVGSGGETGSYTLEEALELQRRRIASAEANPSTDYPAQNDDSVKNLQILVKQNEKRIDVISKQLDSLSEKKVKSLDSKINREQSQYNEYLKQYNYYEGKTLSPKDEQKFQKVVNNLNSQNERVNSLIDERNMVVLENDEVPEIIEQKVTTPSPVKQVQEKPQKEPMCFLFWCW